MNTEGMIEAVGYYQQRGFFSTWIYPEIDLVRALDTYAARHSSVGRRATPLADWQDQDLALLQLDENRILWLDFEVEAVGGSRMYIETLPRLARISRGVFSAWDISEQALDEERGGPVKLSFRVGAELLVYEVGGGNTDWIDAQVLWIVEALLQVSPYRLHAAVESLTEQGAVLAVMTPEERDRIDRDRGLAFVPLPDTPTSPWDWNTQELLDKVRSR